MIKRLIGYTLAAGLLSPLCIRAQAKTFTVLGRIGTLNAPAKAYIVYESGGSYIEDSALLKNGAFRFGGTIDEPYKGFFVLDAQGLGMRAAAAGHRINFYIEPGTINIESADPAGPLQISGTPLNADNEQLRAELKPVFAHLAALQKTDTARRDTAAWKALEQTRDEVLTRFIKSHPGSLVSFDALKYYGGVMPDPARVEPAYRELSDSLRATPAVMAYHQLLETLKKTAVGQIAPDFTEPDTAGKAVSLHAFRGKYVLLDFWASWCKPCRRENPNVVKAFHKYKDKGFTVVSVSLDGPNARKNWLKAIHTDGLSGWTHLSDLNFWDNAAAKRYGIRSIPQNFLLDKEGKIIAKDLRGEALEEELEQVLGG